MGDMPCFGYLGVGGMWATGAQTTASFWPNARDILGRVNKPMLARFDSVGHFTSSG